MSQIPRVEMHGAYLWTCDFCGIDNFERSIAYEPGSAVLEELDDDDLSAMDACGALSGGWYSYPDRVTCKGCGAEYAACHPGQFDEEDQ